MNIPNAYCIKHDEMESQDNTEFWICPQCSKENINRFRVRNADGKLPLDAATEKMNRRLKFLDSKLMEMI